MGTFEQIDTQEQNKLAQPGGYYLHSRPEVLERVPLGARRILDVGCGGGGLSAAIKARQPAEVHGVEIVAEAAEHARVHLDKVWNCSIEDALDLIPDYSYECIVIADVLEHLNNPVQTLSKLQKKLVPDGLLVASIPNIQNWDVLSRLLQGKWDYSSEGILDRTHLRFFTRKSTEELFWNASLQIVDLATTRRGTATPKTLLASMSSNGLASASLQKDGETFQFLIKATPADTSPKPKVTVVILNWNGKDDTLECLSSVYQSAYPNFDVVVVDNNSSDDSVEAIKERFPQVVMRQTGSNLGYAGGNNFGMKWALDQRCDYVFVLNNDTTISPSCISELVEADVISNSGVLGPTNFYFSEPSKIWTIGARRCGLPDPGYTIMGEGDKSNDWPHLLSLDAIVGSAILIRRDVIEKVGVFDEKFFLCWEEFDFCARSIEVGFRCMYVPRAAIFHKVGSSLGESFSPLRTYFNERNKLLWTKKHGTKAEISTASRESIKSALRILFPPLTLPTGDLPVHKRVIWAAHSWLKTVSSRLAIEKNKATLLAVRDYHLGRFGDCPTVLRKARS